MATIEKLDVGTRVEDMPPLHVTTEGIPAQEHIEAERARSRTRQHRSNLITWSIVGLVLVLFGLFAVLVYTPTDDTHMGLSPTAWSQYRAGEREAAPASVTHMGLSPTAWSEYRAGERVAQVTPTYPFTAITP